VRIPFLSPPRADSAAAGKSGIPSLIKRNTALFASAQALQGGGTQCLRIDPVAKSMGQMLLEYPVPVSRQIAREFGVLEAA